MSMNRPAVLVAITLALSGCAPGSESERMAGEGAKYGAVGGAVAGAVSALIFGGNPLQGAVAGGITGAASGAATGAMAGSQRDAARAKPIAGDPKLAALREKIGDTNYAAALQLAQCQHRGAITTAQEAVDKAQDPHQKTAGLAIQALAAEESGDKALAASLYPKIIELNPARGSPDKLRADALEGLMRVQAARREHGLPPICSPR
jgi:Flp pilus assembly protein TadD